MHSHLKKLVDGGRARAYAATAVAAIAACGVAGCGGTREVHHGTGRASHSSLAPRSFPSASTTRRAAHNVAASTGVAGDALTVQLWLRPALAAAERFATAVSTPGNPAYRDFLTPDAYTARFGASAQQAAHVVRWLRSRGFSAVSVSAQRDYVQGSASTATLEAALHIRLRSGVHSMDIDEGVAASGGRASGVPRSLASDVLGITGVPQTSSAQSSSSSLLTEEDAPAAGSGSRHCSAYLGQRTLSGLPPEFGHSTLPLVECGADATQYRSAYGANMRNIGAGQTIAFDEAGGLVPDMFQTLKEYARRNHLPAPSRARYREINEQPGSCTKRQESMGEEQMDVEAAYAMAPRATQIVVGANLCQGGTAGRYQPALDADIAIINGNGKAPLASVVSNSWETGYDDQPRSIDEIETAYLVKAAAVGVGMYYSAGDSPCVTQPASNPYATGVGGTTLAISRTGHRVFETGGGFAFATIKHGRWRIGQYFGYGGGQSRVYRQPEYQKGVAPLHEHPRQGREHRRRLPLRGAAAARRASADAQRP